MAKTARTRPLDIALLAVSALLVVGILTFAGPCVHDGESFGECFNAAAGVAGAGIFLAGVAMFLLLSTAPTARIVLGLVALALAAFVAIAPGNALPLCADGTMQCHLVMQPFALACGAVAAIISLATIAFAFRSH